MKYCFQISYNGASYCGWQRQKNAHTVQEEIENAISKILKEEIKINGCGRTDTGVHARNYYFDIKTEEPLTREVLHKLNGLCPKDIFFKNIWSVKDDFSTRFDASSRTYTYHISEHKNPFKEAFQLWYKPALDISLMNEACKHLMGKQDFECFSKAKTEVNNFYCTITHAEFVRNDDEIIFTITANRFLRNMVRAIVGTLMDIGIKKNPPEYIIEVIKSKSRSVAGRSVAAKALFLDKIEYDKSTWQSL